MLRLRNRSSKIEMLKTVPMFRGLTQRQLNELAKHADEVHPAEGHVLAREGEQGSELLIVVDGKVRLERSGRPMATLGPGDIFGEMSLIDGEPRSATAVAESPLILLVVHRREFWHLLEQVPTMQERVLKTLSQRLRAADAALYD
jgi:CRP/FNR family transcriptional regulator, cyclic AMP receptor protein